jgi:hypothetical protein
MSSRSGKPSNTRLFMAMIAVSAIQLMACQGSDGPAFKTAHFEYGRLDILEATDVTVSSVVDILPTGPKISDQHDPALKLRLRLTGDRSGNLSLRVDQLCVESTKGENRCKWAWLTMFENATPKGAPIEIGAQLLQVNDKIFSVRQLLPDSSEMDFTFKPGETSEAELLFAGVDRARAASFHFGAYASVRMRSDFRIWPW